MAHDARELPVACTLTGTSYQQRRDWLRQLRIEGLRSHRRDDLVLELRYDRAVADRVRDMVRGEQECCEFLRFEVADTADEIRVTITAPERARAAVDDLFELFLPSAAA